MEIVYLLVPIAILFAAVVVWAFFWSIRSGQFDDLEGPAHRILMDEAEPESPAAQTKTARASKRPRRRLRRPPGTAPKQD